jgi:hypothetical protein
LGNLSDEVECVYSSWKCIVQNEATSSSQPSSWIRENDIPLFMWASAQELSASTLKGFDPTARKQPTYIYLFLYVAPISQLINNRSRLLAAWEILGRSR